MPGDDDDLKTLVRAFRESVTAAMDAQSRQMDALAARIHEAEIAILNEVSDVSRRLGSRLESVEYRLGSLEQRLNGGSQ
jgi:hypothetical protein